METKIINLPTEKIADWDSFHDVFSETFGFPDYYGRNMDAWNDCMSSINSSENGMCRFTIPRGDLLTIKIENVADFKASCPEQYKALLECVAFVNYSRVEIGDAPILALMLIGYY